MWNKTATREWAHPPSSVASLARPMRSATNPFVPEGLNDRSLAIYCQERAENEAHAIGNGGKGWYPELAREWKSRLKRAGRSKKKHHAGNPDHTVPYGTGSLCRSFLAINCQATIIQSLRDIFALSPFRPFALRRHADTPGERAEPRNAPPLLNQLPKLLFIHNSQVERTRLLQLAAGLLTR